MLITVNVTQAHIDQGKIVAAFGCPVALASKELPFQEGIRAGVTHRFLDLSKDGWGVCQLAFPSQTSEWINNFDQRGAFGAVEPFSFNLDIPEEYLKVSEPEARQSADPSVARELAHV